MTREDYRMAMAQERHDEGYPEPVELDEDAAYDRMVEDAIEMAELRANADPHIGWAMDRVLDAAGGRS